jgi:hypothetical protein
MNSDNGLKADFIFKVGFWKTLEVDYTPQDAYNDTLSLSYIGKLEDLTDTTRPLFKGLDEDEVIDVVLVCLIDKLLPYYLCR